MTSKTKAKPAIVEPKPTSFYTVTCNYDVSYYRYEIVEAASPEDACQLAIEQANDDSDWDSYDHCGDTYVIRVKPHKTAKAAEGDQGNYDRDDADAVPFYYRGESEQLPVVTKQRDQLLAALKAVQAWWIGTPGFENGEDEMPADIFDGMRDAIANAEAVS